MQPHTTPPWNPSVPLSSYRPALLIVLLPSYHSGLAAAYRLRKEGVEVDVFEAGSRVGGMLYSMAEEGFQWDVGANTMVSLRGHAFSELWKGRSR